MGAKGARMVDRDVLGNPACPLGMVAEDVMVWAEVDAEQAFRAALPSTRLDEWPLAGVLHHSSIMVRKDTHRATGGSSPHPLAGRRQEAEEQWTFPGTCGC